MKAKMISLVLAAAVSMSAVAQEKKPTLKVGDKAPVLKSSKWVKGKEIKKFAKGHVYVVEFWATWCGPCIAAFPHLSELAAKHKGKVSFVGMNIWERGEEKGAALNKKIGDFVKSQGKNMAYNVAIDDNEWMAKNWMAAAGQNGIPAAFVVGKTGVIEWIGHPMQIDSVLEGVVAGTYDRDAEAKMATRMEELGQAVMVAIQSGDHAAAAAEIDDVIKEYPQMAEPLTMGKISLLMQFDEAAGQVEMGKAADGIFKNDAMTLNQFAWGIVGYDEPQMKKPDYKIGLKIALQAVKASKNKDPLIMDTLAVAYHRNKKLDKAIEFQTKAVKLLETTKDVDADSIKELKDRLKKFKAEAAKRG
jgi:thiol-disulfide isomerase/thioredoxin